MKYSYTIFVSTLLGGGALAANSKLNQYPTLDDCIADTNIISHASPPIDTCHSVDPATHAVFLVTGSGAAGGKYHYYTANNDCSGDDDGQLDEGNCIASPAGAQSIDFTVAV